MATTPPEDPGPEHPNRFPAEPRLEPLDEAPDGHTPAESTDGDEASLPPGAPRRDDDEDGDG